MTCNILTPGHIKCLRYLALKGDVVIGLLTAKALRGYKKELMPWKDRKYILENLNFLDIAYSPYVIPQNNLNPLNYIKKYQCDAIASGDGFEKQEIDAIKKLNLKIINIKLKGEKKKKYSSSKISKRAT